MTNDSHAPISALIPARDDGAYDEPLDEAQEAELQQELYRLLQRRVKYMTMGDSSSVRTEAAEELLKSIIYALSLHMRESGLTRRELIARGLCEVFDDAIATLERETACARTLYERAAAYIPPIANRSYYDTIEGLEMFFRRYDPRLMAHEIPGDIDYQLCLPVDGRLQGVSYVREYLQSLICEQAFLARLGGEQVKRLLFRFCPDPVGLHINLFEPALANAVGAAMAGLSIRNIDVPTEAGARICNELLHTGDEAVAARVMRAALAVSDALQIRDSRCRDYALKAAHALCPRIKAAAQSGDLSRVFISI